MVLGLLEEEFWGEYSPLMWGPDSEQAEEPSTSGMQGTASDVTCERCSSPAQARPDPPGATTATSISHISTAGALLNAAFSPGHCRGAPRALSTSPGCLFPSVRSPRCWTGAELLTPGWFCVPLCGCWGPVTPLVATVLSSLSLYQSADSWGGICWHSSLHFPVPFPLSLSSNPFQLISTGLVCWDHHALFVRLVKNPKLLFAEEILLFNLNTNYELLTANLQIRTSAPPCRWSSIVSKPDWQTGEFIPNVWGKKKKPQIIRRKKINR